MSANNQILVKEYNGKFYVFDVMAESWGEWDMVSGKFTIEKNKLYIGEAKGKFSTRQKAHDFANSIEDNSPWGSSEYGVIDEVLYKDGAEVTLCERDGLV